MVGRRCPPRWTMTSLDYAVFEHCWLCVRIWLKQDAIRGIKRLLIVLQRRFLDLVSFWAEIASQNARGSKLSSVWADSHADVLESPVVRTVVVILNQSQGGMCIAGVLKTISRTPRRLTSPLAPTGGDRRCGLAICTFHLGFSLGLQRVGARRRCPSPRQLVAGPFASAPCVDAFCVCTNVVQEDRVGE